MKALTKYQVPFSVQNGNQMREANTWGGKLDPSAVMKDNIPFTDTLKYIEYDENYRTKSVYVKMQRMVDGSHVYLFFSDFSTLIPLLNNGEVTGEWAFIKRGPKYGCYMIQHIPKP
jgi:hypothetical protein